MADEGTELGVHALLLLAHRASMDGQSDKADTFYWRALNQAEQVYGPDDAGVGRPRPPGHD